MKLVLRAKTEQPPNVASVGSPTPLDAPKIRHSTALVDGLRVHWAEAGETSERTPVVLLHGLNDSHLTWKRVAPILATDRRVLMPDLLGHGLSERPNASYELQWHAQMLAKWLDVMALDRVDMVGHSFGGGVAQVLLLERPGAIRRLVLVASGGLGRDVAAFLRWASVSQVVERFGQRFMALGTRIAFRGERGGFTRQDIRDLGAMNSTPGSARAFARTVRDVIDWRGQRRTFSQRAHELGNLPPIAVFWGDRDSVIPASHGRAFAETVEGVALRHFGGCGHYLHNEESEEFVRTVRAFLDDPAAQPARIRATGERNEVAAGPASRGTSTDRRFAGAMRPSPRRWASRTEDSLGGPVGVLARNTRSNRW